MSISYLQELVKRISEILNWHRGKLPCLIDDLTSSHANVWKKYQFFNTIIIRLEG